MEKNSTLGMNGLYIGSMMAVRTLSLCFKNCRKDMGEAYKIIRDSLLGNGDMALKSGYALRVIESKIIDEEICF